MVNSVQIILSLATFYLCIMSIKCLEINSSYTHTHTLLSTPNNWKRPEPEPDNEIMRVCRFTRNLPPSLLIYLGILCVTLNRTWFICSKSILSSLEQQAVFKGHRTYPKKEKEEKQCTRRNMERQNRESGPLGRNARASFQKCFFFL